MTRSRLRSALLFVLVSFGFAFWPFASRAALSPAKSITATGVAVTENFDSMLAPGSTTPDGWGFDESTGGTDAYLTDNGALNVEDTYSYGSLLSTDRAFGSLSGSGGGADVTIGAVYQNDTAVFITDLEISYVGERWRVGGTGGGADGLQFGYSVGNTSITGGTFVAVNALGYTAANTGAVGALDGNANQTVISSTITGLSIAPGDTIALRWRERNGHGGDAEDGVAIDDFSMTANSTDADGDGVGDGVDECPGTAPGTNVAPDGCDDTDNDDVSDDDDNCDSDANPGQENNDNDAEGDACDGDDDNDTVLDGSDNCPFESNPGQEDADSDNVGDACENDDDNDGVADGSDNCPLVSNAGQENTDGDGQGDACDGDDDDDGVADGSDNCPLDVNPGQENSDADPDGDACDGDDDDDTVPDGSDNCPTDANTGQEDEDADSIGDACDPDVDGDGVDNGDDVCPNTPTGTNVNADGCPDADDDGVADGDDLCPGTLPGTNVNADGCPDDDGDGVDNTTDQCPDTPDGQDVNAVGCPQATQSICGDVLLADVTLSQNITCDGDGFIVGRNGITINLNGFDLTGNGSTGTGIRNSKRSVRIVNTAAAPSVVSGFEDGIISGGKKSVVRNLEVTDNDDDGVVMSRGKKWRVASNNVHDNGGDGINLVKGKKGKVTGNTVTDNGGAGIRRGPKVKRLQLKANVVSGNLGGNIV